MIFYNNFNFYQANALCLEVGWPDETRIRSRASDCVIVVGAVLVVCLERAACLCRIGPPYTTKRVSEKALAILLRPRACFL